MADKTGIYWTGATWNPVVGCSIHSPGCRRCYAMKMARRIERMGGKGGEKYRGLTKIVNGKPVWTGEVREHTESLDQPIRWRKPRVIFVNSMSDLFHRDLRRETIDRVFHVMARSPQHVFQILTKRADEMPPYLANGQAAAQRISRLAPSTLIRWPLPNVWFGVSVENQRYADERREHLRKVAELGWKTWVSYEPALGGVDWSGWEFIKCLVSGGESGDDASPTHPDWHRWARDWCAAHGIAYGLKQWGAWKPVNSAKLHPDRTMIWAMPSHQLMVKVGASRAGRTLDGRLHDGVPA